MPQTINANPPSATVVAIVEKINCTKNPIGWLQLVQRGAKNGFLFQHSGQVAIYLTSILIVGIGLSDVLSAM